MAHGYYDLQGGWVATATLEEATAAWRAERGYDPIGVFDMGDHIVDTTETSYAQTASAPAGAANLAEELAGGPTALSRRDEALYGASPDYYQSSYDVQGIQSLASSASVPGGTATQFTAQQQATLDSITDPKEWISLSQTYNAQNNQPTNQGFVRRDVEPQGTSTIYDRGELALARLRGEDVRGPTEEEWRRNWETEAIAAREEGEVIGAELTAWLNDVLGVDIPFIEDTAFWDTTHAAFSHFGSTFGSIYRSVVDTITGDGGLQSNYEAPLSYDEQLDAIRVAAVQSQAPTDGYITTSEEKIRLADAGRSTWASFAAFHDAAFGEDYYHERSAIVDFVSLELAQTLPFGEGVDSFQALSDEMYAAGYSWHPDALNGKGAFVFDGMGAPPSNSPPIYSGGYGYNYSPSSYSRPSSRSYGNYGSAQTNAWNWRIRIT